MKQLTIKSSLIGRSETFKLLAVAQATSKPILLVGVPGTGKTKSLLDYGLAMHQGDAVRTMNETFILETDESTRSPELKGRPDLKKIVEQNTYDVVSPVAQAKFILINEIDKANAGLRNSMLSIMNEKVLFNGVKKVPVPWELFCASCNKIPQEEKGSPFWDRFVIKHEVKRITRKQLMKYFENGGTMAEEKILIPEPHELEQIKSQIPLEKLEKFLEVAHKQLSDRTLSFVPKMAAAVSVVFQLDLNQSLVKTAQILGGKKMAKDLADIIEPKEVAELRDRIEMIQSLQDYDQINNMVQDIKNMARIASQNPEVTKEVLQDIAKQLNEELNNNPFWNPQGHQGRLDPGNQTSPSNGQGQQIPKMSGQDLSNQVYQDANVVDQEQTVANDLFN